MKKMTTTIMDASKVDILQDKNGIVRMLFPHEDCEVVTIQQEDSFEERFKKFMEEHK